MKQQAATYSTQHSRFAKVALLMVASTKEICSHQAWPEMHPFKAINILPPREPEAVNTGAE